MKKTKDANEVKNERKKEAIKADAKPVYGIKMLLYQGAESFEIWTGKKAPVDVMHDALIKYLRL